MSNVQRIDFDRKTPQQCSDGEIQDFVAFVTAGGEVTTDGLKLRVCRASLLLFARQGDCLKAIAALKNPSKNHRSKVFGSAGVSSRTINFPLELGWVYVLPSSRGQKVANRLVSASVQHASTKGVFATTRSDNVAMLCALKANQFVVAGESYRSEVNKGAKLILLVREP